MTGICIAFDVMKFLDSSNVLDETLTTDVVTSTSVWRRLNMMTMHKRTFRVCATALKM